ncbi:MAG: hypothetical protein ACKVKG_08490 [Alphaproteobacteria bacterium]|jgi:hypothetical protein
MALSAVSSTLSASLSAAAGQNGVLALKLAAQQEQAIVALVVEASQGSQSSLSSAQPSRVVDISV